MTSQKSSVVRTPLSRREFLCQTAHAACVAGVASVLPGVFGAAEAPGAAQKALVGSNVYGWTQYYQRDKKPFDIGEVMSALSDSGYDYLESFMDAGNPENGAKLAAQMKAKGLKPVTIYTGARLHEAERAKEVVKQILTAAKVCREAGFIHLSCNPDPIGREKTEPELQTQAAALKELGAGLKEMGMKLGIHHHTPEFLSQAREFHYNFRHTDPDTVGFCYDVHWVFKGGIMPPDALKEYGKRITLWHLRQSRDGVWWEDLDSGDIDFAAIAKYVNDHNLSRLYTVELAIEGGTKITRSAMENHRSSREFVRKVFGV